MAALPLRRSSKRRSPAIPCSSPWTATLQRVAQVSLEQNVQAARENGERLTSTKGGWNGQDCTIGAAVVLRVKDNAVLAAAGNENYDLEKYTYDNDYKNQVLTNENHPPGEPGLYRHLHARLLLQAGGGLRSPAGGRDHQQYDVPLHAHVPALCRRRLYAALLGHARDPFAAPARWPNRATSSSLKPAITPGIETMNLYCRRFGLGEKTGVELNESEGILAGPEEYAERGKTWVGGDVVQAAIGQSDNQFTPLQLATYASTIANNGVRYQTHLVSKITDYARKEVVMENDPDNPTVVAETGVSEQNFEYVKEGMRAVITDSRGSAHRNLGNYPVPIAGKTGTAQGPGSDNVAFIGFAPYDDPEIAVAVILQARLHRHLLPERGA